MDNEQITDRLFVFGRYNSGTTQVEGQFNISSEVALLGMTFYLLGYISSPSDCKNEKSD